MKIAIIRSSWMKGYGYRLDTQPYVGGALQTKILLEKLPLQKDRLDSLCSGILNIGRIKRDWVEDSRFGIPFLSGSDIQKADISNLSLISKRAVRTNPDLVLKKGMTLITRSGTIGIMAYCREEMKGKACTEDVLRVTPDPAKIPPGYLYAFLSSKFGVPLVASGTYGAIIQHLEPEHIAGIDIPRLSHAKEQEIHELVEEAARLRSEASSTLKKQANRFDDLLNFDIEPQQTGWWQIVSSESLALRMDGGYYNPASLAARKTISESQHEPLRTFCKKIFLPGIFKRIYANDEEHGTAYYHGYSLFNTEPEPKGFLSASTSKMQDIIMKEGEVLVQAFGSDGGLIGRSTWVTKHLSGAATTHMLVRLLPKDEALSGYLYSFLNSKLGYAQISALAYGSPIPHFDPISMATVLIPILDGDVVTRINSETKAAMQSIEMALDHELKARSLIEIELTAK
jgi:type I restriction enzyme S subunit